MRIDFELALQEGRRGDMVGRSPSALASVLGLVFPGAGPWNLDSVAPGVKRVRGSGPQS